MMSRKNKFPALVLVILAPILACYFPSQNDRFPAGPRSYAWKQILPFGSGSHQDEWKSGTFPLGLKPIVAFGGELWMIGQKAAWSSKDGTTWTKHSKKDWGERISMSYIFFDNKLWMCGGMLYQDRKLVNEVWFSSDGVNWQQAENAPWQPRKGVGLAVFNNKMWLLGGVTQVSKDFGSLNLANDIWSTSDGISWTLETAHAAWSPRELPQLLTLRDTLYLLGGQELADVWRSTDGKTWTMLTAEAAWKKRSDHGALVFDDKLWVFGGRDTLSNHNLAAQNDVWFSDNGLTWTQQTQHAPWTVRSGGASVIFRDRLWLFSGKHTGGNQVWKGDVWAMVVQ